jgi:AcrR family transcriptional regulator
MQTEAEQVLGHETVPLRERKRLRMAGAIYDAALELLAETPYDDVSIEDICNRAEVGRATFFRFYGSKAGLLREFNRRISERAAANVAAAGGASATERMYIVQRTIADAWEHSGDGLKTMATEVARAGVPTDGGATYEDMNRLAADIIAEGFATGEFADRGLSASLVGWVVISALAACVVGSLRGRREESLEKLTRAALDMLLDGMRA